MELVNWVIMHGDNLVIILGILGTIIGGPVGIYIQRAVVINKQLTSLLASTPEKNVSIKRRAKKSAMNQAVKYLDKRLGKRN